MKSVKNILGKVYPSDLVEATLSAFEEIHSAFQSRRWKASELESGHFVEAVRRILEFELTGVYTAIGNKLPHFNQQALQGYERQKGHESYRILIPRVLWAAYAIRNKRGVAHVGEVSPNEVDATIILRTSKWVLAELVRLKSSLSHGETESLIHSIIQKESPLVWVVDGRERVLAPSLKAADKVMVILYTRSPRALSELQDITEYKNSTTFRRIVTDLHKEKLLDLGPDDVCHISPLGELRAEEILERT